MARITEENEAIHGHEHDGIRWFTKEELESEEYDIPEYVRNAGKRALKQSKN